LHPSALGLLPHVVNTCLLARSNVSSLATPSNDLADDRLCKGDGPLDSSTGNIGATLATAIARQPRAKVPSVTLTHNTA